jgi:WD40-like Beta Propeller Repeat
VLAAANCGTKCHVQGKGDLVFRKVVVVVAAAVLASPATASATSVRGSIVASDFDGKVSLVDPATKRVRALGGIDRKFGDYQRSRDGRSLVSVDTTDQGTFVKRYSIASGTVQTLGPFPVTGEFVHGFALSPDGRRVALATATYTLVPDPVTPGRRIYSDGPVRMDVIDLSTGTVTPLVEPIPARPRTAPFGAGPYGDHQPDSFGQLRWSPNGRSIAFVHRHKWGVTDPPPGDTAFTHLKLVNPDGSGLRVLVDDVAGDDSNVAWSPDSRRLAVVTGGGLQLVNAATGVRSRKLAPRGASSMAFSPSGRHLAYIVTDNSGGPGGKSGLHVRNLKTLRDIKPRINRPHDLSWSPKAERLVVCSERPKRGTRVGLSLIDTKGKISFLAKRNLCSPFWSTDNNAG